MKAFLLPVLLLLSASVDAGDLGRLFLTPQERQAREARVDTSATTLLGELRRDHRLIERWQSRDSPPPPSGLPVGDRYLANRERHNLLRDGHLRQHPAP